MTPPHPPAQHGAITLLVALGLVILASMTAFFSARSVLVDQLASHNHARSSQARWAAEAALASAQSALLQSPNLSAFMATPAACPLDLTGPQWQCSAIAVAAHPSLPGAEWRVVAVRDVVHAPHVLTLHARARLPGQHSQAHVRESVWVPSLAPAPEPTTPAALVLNGCITEAPNAQLQVCPLTHPEPGALPQAPSPGALCTGPAEAPAVLGFFVPETLPDGVITQEETRACLALRPSALPAGGRVVGPATAQARSPCRRAAWQHVLGATDDQQLQDLSNAQERQGLTAHTSPPRTVYWVDSPAAWSDSVGTTNSPVLLVFSAQACAFKCPHLLAHTHVVGSVVFNSGCQDEKMRGWQAGQITGQLVVESGMPDWTSGRLLASPDARKAFSVHWPPGMDASTLQRVMGSWSQGAP